MRSSPLSPELRIQREVERKARPNESFESLGSQSNPGKSRAFRGSSFGSFGQTSDDVVEHAIRPGAIGRGRERVGLRALRLMRLVRGRPGRGRRLNLEDAEHISPLAIGAFAALAVPVELAKNNVLRGGDVGRRRRLGDELELDAALELVTVETRRARDEDIDLVHRIEVDEVERCASADGVPGVPGSFVRDVVLYRFSRNATLALCHTELV